MNLLRVIWISVRGLSIWAKNPTGAVPDLGPWNGGCFRSQMGKSEILYRVCQKLNYSGLRSLPSDELLPGHPIAVHHLPETKNLQPRKVRRFA